MAAFGRSDEDLIMEMKKEVEPASRGSWPTSSMQRGFM